MKRILRYLLPDLPPLSVQERIRSAGGALLGILGTGWMSRAALGETASIPILIAPMGASAVLLFAAPASPLAQPWSILGGNLVAAAIGVTAAAFISDPFVAAALAVGGAIAAMMALRCLHPPSGAVALTAVLGGAAITDLGYGFVLWPVGANSLLLLSIALVYNNLTGRSYPHVPLRSPADRRADGADSSGRVASVAKDLDAILKDHELLDIGRSDLKAILSRAQMLSYGRRPGQTTCGEIMARDVVAIAPDASLREALDLLRQHRIKALPVTDERARVVGIVTQTDLLEKAYWDASGPRLGWRGRLRVTLRRGRAPSGRVEDIMTISVKTGRPDMTVTDVVLRMVDVGLHSLPVVGADDRLVGMVTQTDLVTALLSDAAAAAAA